MNQTKVIEQARQLAATAKPGWLKMNGKLYTFSFCQKEWFYQVFEDGFWLVNFNTKSLPVAKKYLKEYLSN